MNTPINTHFNVSDQELAAANGGAIGAVLKAGAKAALKSGAKQAAGGAAGYGFFKLLGLA